MTGSKKGQPRPTVAEIADDVAADRAALSQTVSELAAKVDVKARAGRRVEAVKDRVVEAGSTVKDKTADFGSTVKDKAASLGETARYEADQVSGEVAETTDALMARVRRHPLPYVLAAGAVLIIVVLAASRRRHH